ncbi:MAG: BMP family ABC transporter substrate-binding protein [Chloroflexi bacterium]|jgi:basic membrane protein A|nr:BMP family ABC transporter substrate-binding protein [Chloroflexota bacterium]
MFHQKSNITQLHRVLSAACTLVLVFSIFFFPQASQAADTKDPNMVGFIPDIGGIDDNGFNEMAYIGLTRAVTDLGVVGTVYETTSFDDYPIKLAECVTDGNALCITVGWSMGEATLNAAAANPTVNFAIVDMTWDSYPDNLRSLMFAAEEAGYLAGTLAGLMTTSNIIGAIGGFPIPPVDAFMYPYMYGAHWANPDTHVLFNYAYNFGDPDLGAQIAQDQMAQGADVIFGVGGMMGNGAILAAAQAGAWVIGVDADAYDSVFGGGTVDGSEFLLTSAMKRVDNAVYNTIADQIDGLFTPGTVIGNLENGGVGLAPYHEADSSIPQDVKDQVDAVKQGIINGEINVWQPYWTLIYLPAILK